MNGDINACVTFKSVWGLILRAPFPLDPVTKLSTMSYCFIRTSGKPRARVVSWTRSFRLGASKECVKRCATLRLSKTYLSNKIFPWAKGWLPWKRRSSAFFDYIHFQWAHRPWSQRKFHVQTNLSIAENLRWRKLFAMRSNVYQKSKYDVLILRRDKIYQNM